MRRLIPSALTALLVIAGLLVAGCQDSFLTGPEKSPSPSATTAQGPPGGTPGGNAPSGSGVPNVTVGTEVSVWDSDLETDLQNGILPIGGSGQINGEFTVAERGGIQIALRAQERFEGPIEASGKKIGRYETETGTSPRSETAAKWNFDWHVDLRGTGTTLGDYDLTLHLTNVTNEWFFDLKNPVDLTFEGRIPDNTVLYQSSQNPTFGNEQFDPQKEGTYNLRLKLSPKRGGPPLSTAIQVRVEDPN